MARTSAYQRSAAPPREKATKLSGKDFLFIHEIALLAGVTKETAELIIHQSKLRPYMFEDKQGNAIPAYLTCKIRKVLAARGHVIPGFNEHLTTGRQWLELIDAATEKPLDKDWYFQPVNPDPLLRVTEEQAEKILEKVKLMLAVEGAPSEVLRLVADVINEESRTLTITSKTF